MAESGPLGVLLKASVGDAARFCASRDRQSTGNSRSKPHGPKTRASCVVVQNVPLGALISKRAAAAPGRRKCHPCLTEPPPQKAPDRRGGGARRVGSARARAARGWGQGAGAGCRCLGEHVRHAGRDSFMIKDAKSKTVRSLPTCLICMHLHKAKSFFLLPLRLRRVTVPDGKVGHFTRQLPIDT